MLGEHLELEAHSQLINHILPSRLSKRMTNFRSMMLQVFDLAVCFAIKGFVARSAADDTRLPTLNTNLKHFCNMIIYRQLHRNLIEKIDFIRIYALF